MILTFLLTSSKSVLQWVNFNPKPWKSRAKGHPGVGNLGHGITACLGHKTPVPYCKISVFVFYCVVWVVFTYCKLAQVGLLLVGQDLEGGGLADSIGAHQS